MEYAERIRCLRGQLVILDIELAVLFGITPDRLNALVQECRPSIKKEFAFPLDLHEIRELELGPSDAEPYECKNARMAFTEHGVIVAGALLDDSRAVQQSIELVRAFVARRESAGPSQRKPSVPQLH